jgi:HEAT repeat protein
VPELRQAVSHPLPGVRRQAIRTLALLGGATAGSARADVEAALKDKDAAVRTLAALAFTELGDFATPPPAGLMAALQDVDPVVRLAAARSLARYQACERQQLAAVLLGLLTGSVVDFGKAGWSVGLAADNRRPYAESKGGLHYYAMYWEETAAHALIELGPKFQPAPEVLVEMLKECPHDGRHLVHLLAAQGDAAKSVMPQLVLMVKDKDSRQRRKALLALGRLGLPRAAEALPEIRAALKHPDGRTRWRGFLALALLDASAVKQTLPATLHAAVDAAAASAVHPRLDAVDKWTRCQWQYHPLILLPATSEGSDAFKRFEPWTLSDEEVWVEKERVDAVLAAVDKAGPTGEASVGLVLGAWQANSRTPSDRMRHGDKALTLLAREGAAAKSAIPALINGLSWYDTPKLAKAFVQIGDPAVPELAKALANVDLQDLWPAVLMALQQFGPRAEAAVPAVVKLLSSPEEAVGQLAAATLGSAGSGAKDAVPELQKMLRSPVSDTRRHAVDALGLIGAPAKTTLPDLIGLFDDDSQQMRVVAIRAVSRLGKDAIEPLTSALTATSENARLGAVQALARMDREALPALPALRQLDRDDQPVAIRQAAKELASRLEMGASEIKPTR